jgi:predicted pyridoxine 5'-phosphate oxidase superfamily flavin-nucleotide-binding protein
MRQRHVLTESAEALKELGEQIQVMAVVLEDMSRTLEDVGRHALRAPDIAAAITAGEHDTWLWLLHGAEQSGRARPDVLRALRMRVVVVAV